MEFILIITMFLTEKKEVVRNITIEKFPSSLACQTAKFDVYNTTGSAKNVEVECKDIKGN